VAELADSSLLHFSDEKVGVAIVLVGRETNPFYFILVMLRY